MGIGILVNTPTGGESEGIVLSDTNVNCCSVPVKSISTYMNTYVRVVFYVSVGYLYFISTLIFNKNASVQYI